VVDVDVTLIQISGPGAHTVLARQPFAAHVSASTKVSQGPETKIPASTHAGKHSLVPLTPRSIHSWRHRSSLASPLDVVLASAAAMAMSARTMMKTRIL
jgi:hypothetical protein